MKTIKKVLAVVLTLAMVLTIAPSFTAVKAGGGVDISGLPKGINSNNTVDPGTTIKVSRSDIRDTLGQDFLDRLDNGKADLRWEVTKGDIGTPVVLTIIPEQIGDNYIVEIDLKYVGMRYTFYTHDTEDTSNNNNTTSYPVNSAEVTILEGPTFGSIYETQTFLSKNFSVWINGYGKYKINNGSKEYYVYEKIVKLYKNGKLYATRKTKENNVDFKNVPVSYGKNDTFKLELCMMIGAKEISGVTKTFTSTSAKLPNIKVIATKISKKKAYLRWQSVDVATGYYIYMGSKKVKTVGKKTTKCMITKKKAGKSKYKVIPYVKSGKTIIKSNSNQAKPGKNQIKYYRATNPSAYTYATCPFVITKISLSGKTYTVTGYAVNNRIFKCKKYKTLKIALKVDGKKAFSKKYKNFKLNVGDTKAKKFTLKIKGKAGRDVANGARYLTVGQDPVWDGI